MQDPIAFYLEQYKALCSTITEEEQAFIKSHLTVSNLKVKDLYLRVGEVQRSIAFLVKGLMRIYYIDNKGNSITVWFAKEGEYATEYTSFIRQKPSIYHIECLEHCTVINLPFTAMQAGYEKYKNIEKYGRLITEEVFVLQQNRIQSFLFCNAEERYLDFIKNQAGLLNRITLTDLASFLGLERQSLSRIRKAISIKKDVDAP